jgi:hypothetical protein
MQMLLVNPMREAAGEPAMAAPRLRTLKGKTLALLDISKPGGSIFLDRLSALLTEREGVGAVHLFQKPTFAKPAPVAVLDTLAATRPDAVIEGLAD